MLDAVKLIGNDASKWSHVNVSQFTADLQSGTVQPVDQATARDRIEERIRDRRAR